MPKALDGLQSDQISAILTHPVHQEGTGMTARSIHRLRGCESNSDLYEFQHELLDRLLAVQEHGDGCSRVVKRLKKGGSVPGDAVELRGAGDPNELETWQLEHDVCERVGRQLQCVGDALAWKVFDYQRNFIVVLSRNEPPGPMSRKAGLIAEREFITNRWRKDGQFAILHDLTSCLRIGDASVFTPDYVRVEEIKTNEKRRTAKQERRRLMAAEALRSGTPMPGGAGQVLVKIDLPIQLTSTCSAMFST